MLNLKKYYLFYNKKISDYIKSTFDIFMASIALLILSVPMLIIALVIKLTSKGSILFKQKRIGFNGKEFEIYKFRTMREGAEEYTKHLTPKQVEEFILNNFKLNNDPRLTYIGKILRKISIDEIPQIINVFKREMSIVGPRPVSSEEIHKFGSNYDIILSVKPGITGLAQINGRSDISFEKRLKLDILYANNSNLFLDISIVLKTILVVLRMKGV